MQQQLRAPVRTVAPVAGTSAGTYVFSAPVRVLNVFNLTGVAAFVLLNGTGASATNYDFSLSDGGSQIGPVDKFGIDSVASLSVFIATSGDVDKFHVKGI